MTLSEHPKPDPPTPGWYPDPLGGQSVRYFDGSEWTENLHAPESAKTASLLKKPSLFPRPHWRKMTWAIVIWSLVMALWIIGGIVSADPGHNCVHHAYLSKQTCEDASNAGTGIGVIALWFVWFFGFIVLSLIWFMTRPKGRICPACGERVKKGRTECSSCGHDFAAAARGAVPQQA